MAHKEPVFEMKVDESNAQLVSEVMAGKSIYVLTV